MMNAIMPRPDLDKSNESVQLASTKPQADTQTDASIQKSGAVVPVPSTTTQDCLPEAANEPTFTIFPKLPLELRLKIWESVDLEPRVVRIERHDYKHEGGISCRSPVSCFLQVNQESRRAISKSYKRMTKTSQVCINPFIDVFLVCCRIDLEEYLCRLAPNAATDDTQVITRQEMRSDLKCLIVAVDTLAEEDGSMKPITDLRGLESFGVMEIHRWPLPTVDELGLVWQDWERLWKEFGGAPLLFKLSLVEYMGLEKGRVAGAQEKIGKAKSDRKERLAREEVDRKEKIAQAEAEAEEKARQQEEDANLAATIPSIVNSGS